MILDHEWDDAAVVGVFVKRLQDIEHDHVWPEIWLTIQRGFQAAGAEPAAFFLAREHSINPMARFGGNPFIAEHVTQIAKAFEPVGQLFPAAMALAGGGGP